MAKPWSLTCFLHVCYFYFSFCGQEGKKLKILYASKCKNYVQWFIVGKVRKFGGFFVWVLFVGFFVWVFFLVFLRKHLFISTLSCFLQQRIRYLSKSLESNLTKKCLLNSWLKSLWIGSTDLNTNNIVFNLYVMDLKRLQRGVCKWLPKSVVDGECLFRFRSYQTS